MNFYKPNDRNISGTQSNSLNKRNNLTSPNTLNKRSNSNNQNGQITQTLMPLQGTGL